MRKQAATRLQTKIQYGLKTLLTAAIGIRYLRQPGAGSKVQEQTRGRCRVLRANAVQVCQIRLIHREDQIETSKIRRMNLTRTQRAQIDTARQCRALRTRIRCIAAMKVRSSGRVQFPWQRSVNSGQKVAHSPFRRRTPTYVSKADKKNPHRDILATP